MDDLPSLLVKEGDELTPKLWDGLARAVRSARILFGDGIRGRRLPDGTLLSCSYWSPWPHPFKVAIAGADATVSKGTMGGTEVTLGGVPISGTSSKPQPILDLSSPKYNEDGMGWIAIEVMIDSSTYKQTSAELVQVSSLSGVGQYAARHPIGLLVRQDSGGFSFFQIAYFNLQHVAYRGTGVTRHFFWPA